MLTVDFHMFLISSKDQVSTNKINIHLVVFMTGISQSLIL